MKADVLDKDAKLAAARMIASDKFPYLTHAILSLIPRWDERTIDPGGNPTMGVTKTGLLLIHPAAIDKWTQGEVAGVYVHEAQHLLRDHNGRRDTTAAEPTLWNFGADLAINHEIVACCPHKDAQPHTICLPPGARQVVPASFGFKDGLTAEEYYHLIRQQADKNQGPTPCCGSGSGNPLPNEPNDGSGRSEAELSTVRKETAEAIKAAEAKQAGTVPGDLLRWADQQLTPPKVRWQDKLARACRNAMAWKAGCHDYTYSRISRRQWGLGVGVGNPIFPAMRSPIPEVVLGFDTSGSMGFEEITEGASEVVGVMRAAGAPIQFMAFDCDLHSVAPIEKWQDIKRLLKGGGGTDFCPFFKAIDRVHRRPTLAIVVTDGMGPAPKQPPAGMSVIWLLVGGNTQVPATWGTAIIIDKEGAKEVPVKAKKKKAV